MCRWNAEDPKARVVLSSEKMEGLGIGRTFTKTIKRLELEGHVNV